MSLPLGPVWVLHSFHVVVSAAMLTWHLRFAGERTARGAGIGGTSRLACET